MDGFTWIDQGWPAEPSRQQEPRRIGQRQFPSLRRLANPSLDGPDLLVGVLPGIDGLMDIGPGGFDAAGRVDGILLVGRVGERRFAVLLEALLRVGVTPAVNLLGHYGLVPRAAR